LWAFFAQQLPVPVPSHARSTANTDTIFGEGSAPLPKTALWST
jgi:hypothetical protein